MESHPSISKLPIWSLPRAINMMSEIAENGAIIRIDTSDPECVQLVSTFKTRYRMDLISKTGSTTTYINKEIYELLTTHRDDFILEAVFGPPSPSISGVVSLESLGMIEAC